MPRQNSSGGKQRLGGITKQGDRYLRQLLVVGAVAILGGNQSAPNLQNRVAGAKAVVAKNPGLKLNEPAAFYHVETPEKAAEAVGRNPGASGKILVQAIIGMALAEGLGILALFLASRFGIPRRRPWKKMVRICTESAMAMVTRIWITLTLALSRLRPKTPTKRAMGIQRPLRSERASSFSSRGSMEMPKKARCTSSGSFA